MVFTKELVDSYQTLSQWVLGKHLGRLVPWERTHFSWKSLCFPFKLSYIVFVWRVGVKLPGTHGNLCVVLRPCGSWEVKLRSSGLVASTFSKAWLAWCLFDWVLTEMPFMSAFIDLEEIMAIILSNIFFSVPERLSDHVSRATHFFSLYFLPVLAGTAHC